MIISLLSALAAGVVCSLAAYSLASQKSRFEIPDWYGTYQFNVRNLEHIEYLAVIPPSSGDAAEMSGEFQWYHVDQELFAQGTCKIDDSGSMTLFSDGKRIAVLTALDGKYYFWDQSLEMQELTKISKEPLVSTDTE